MELATFSAVVLKNFEDTGRGVAVSQDTEEGDVLLEVPLEHCWTAANARSSLGLEDLSEKEAILVHLMVEASKDEPSKHLKQLPSLESMALPNFWAEQELEELEGSEVHTHAMRLKEELPEDFSRLEQKLSSSEFAQTSSINFASYQWAWSIYSSRVMSLSVNESSALFAIVPGLDMFNHSPSMAPGLFKLDATRNVVVVRAGARLAAGDQAFINYAHPMFNSQMFLSFGFLLQEEILQSSEITLSLQVSPAKLAVWLGRFQAFGVQGEGGSLRGFWQGFGNLKNDQARAAS